MLVERGIKEDVEARDINSCLHRRYAKGACGRRREVVLAVCVLTHRRGHGHAGGGAALRVPRDGLLRQREALPPVPADGEGARGAGRTMRRWESGAYTRGTFLSLRANVMFEHFQQPRPWF